ncbi:CapA family protein [Chloroflexota bacterium]
MEKLIFYASGDVSVHREEPESIFALAKPTLDEADLRFCQLETVYTEEGEGAPNPSYRGAPNPRKVHPRNAQALKFAGFDVVSMAGNHCLDWGYEGLFKTIDVVKQTGAMVIGAGRDIEEARKPCIVERKGIKVAFLAYNSILPTNYWATEKRPGCAPLRAFTIYEPYEYDQPGQPARVHTFVHHGDLAAMEADIRKVRDQADVVVVSLHYGLHFVPAKLADYQREASHAAIDAGADVIIGHHAHILKGIEVYKGKVIFYGLCNFALDSTMRGWPNISPGHREIIELYGWEIDPEWVNTYPHPADSRKTILAKCLIGDKGIERVSFLPVMINKQAQPEILTRDDKRSSEVADYMEWLCRDQGLDVTFSWEGNEIVIGASEPGT